MARPEFLTGNQKLLFPEPVLRQSSIRMKSRVAHGMGCSSSSELRDNKCARVLESLGALSRRLDCDQPCDRPICLPVCLVLYLLRSSIVTVMQAAQSRSRHDRTPVRRANSARRRSLIQAQVSSVFMVVAHIVGEKALQVALVKGNDLI